MLGNCTGGSFKRVSKDEKEGIHEAQWSRDHPPHTIFVSCNDPTVCALIETVRSSY